MNKKIPLLCALALSMPFSHAKTLTQILKYTLENDPNLAEAIANENIAGSRLSQSKANKWPTMSLRASQKVATNKGERDKKFEPRLEAKWTVYDFGRRNAAINRDQFKVDYFSSKTQETAEELIYKISGFYLEALRAKLSLQVAKKNLQRHQQIKNMVATIVEYDSGRRSELTQSNARLLQVKSDMINYQRTLALSLSRIAHYVSPAITEKDLVDPFIHLSTKKLTQKYKIKKTTDKKHPSLVAQAQEMQSIQSDLTAIKKSRFPDIDLIGQVSESESAVYLNFNFDLLNKTTAANIDERHYQIQAAKAKMRQLQRNLDERGQLASLKMREDQSRLKIADSHIKALKQVAKDYENQFSIAKRSLLDVVNAYKELSGIELFKAQVHYDLMAAKLDYLSATGSLRDWVGIKPNKQHFPANSNLDKNKGSRQVLEGYQPIKIKK